MLEELQKKSKSSTISTPKPTESTRKPVGSTAGRIGPTDNMDEMMLLFAHKKEITKEDIWDSQLDVLKKNAEYEQSLPPQRIGPIDRALLLETLENTSRDIERLYFEVRRLGPRSKGVPLIIGVPRIFSLEKVQDLERSM